MKLNYALLLPMYDLAEVKESRLLKTKDVLKNLSKAGVDTIYVLDSIAEDNSKLTYMPFIEELKEYNIVHISENSTGTSTSLRTISSNFINIKDDYQVYLDETGSLLNCVNNLADTLDINKNNENINTEETTGLLDGIAIDLINADNNSEIDSVEYNTGTGLLDDLLSIKEDVERYDLLNDSYNESENLSQEQLLLGLIEQAKVSDDNIKKLKTKAKKKQTYKSKNPKAKKIKVIDYSIYKYEIVKKHLLKVQIVVNPNISAPPLNKLKKLIPDNIFNIDITNTGCKLTLNKSNIKPSYINMEGVI